MMSLMAIKISKHIWKCALCATLINSVFLLGCSSKEERKFYDLELNARDTERSRELVEELKNTKKGVELALKDFNCYGGRTQSWSSSILKKSSLSSQVEVSLTEICTNGDEPMSRRVEAAHILWCRTRDIKWFLDIYSFAQKSGGIPVFFARSDLNAMLNLQFKEYLNIPRKQDLSLTVEQFSNLISEPLVRSNLILNGVY
jgi:hypothetical protein